MYFMRRGVKVFISYFLKFKSIPQIKLCANLDIDAWEEVIKMSYIQPTTRVDAWLSGPIPVHACFF